jgi:hypothetical protein
MAIDIDNAIDEMSRFLLKNYRRDDARLVYELEWRGEGTCLADLNCDFYTLLARFAMEVAFVQRRLANDRLAYECLIGFTSEGIINLYRIQFSITGARVRWILSDKPFFPGYDTQS